ncbi:MAG: glycosyltransferase family 4 protein [Bacteroidota bacterium]
MYSEFMPYNLVVWEVLKKKYDCDLHVVFWDHKKLSPYQYAGNEFNFYPRSLFETQALMELYTKIDPSMLVVSGRMDASYLVVAKFARARGIPTVMASDKQWSNSVRDWIACVFRKFLYSKYFTHAWVAGDRQRLYARKVGFKADKIVVGVYCCDLQLFRNFYRVGKNLSDVLFVGRIEKTKGIDLLVSALIQLRHEGIFNGHLKLVGNGSFETSLPRHSWITHKNFLDQSELRNEVIGTRIFCLPSRYEPWGVVVHEMAAAGLLICCSSACGAADDFVIHKANGYIFKVGSLEDLTNGLRYLFTLSDSQVGEMQKLSVSLSNKVTPEFSASQLMSIFDQCAE